jgi:hypothetical protein
MHDCNHDTRSKHRIPAIRAGLSGDKGDLLLTLLLGLMRFNPQEAMIVRAGLRQAAATVSRLTMRLTARRMPATAGPYGLLPVPYMLALSCLALMVSAGQFAGDMA